jgi:lysozyme
MKASQQLKNLFKEWEGLSQKVYPDSGGLPTIGIGHLLTSSERASGFITINGIAIEYAHGISEQQCWDLLDQDLQLAEISVNKAVVVPLSQNQFDALVSFAFNVGTYSFEKSTLLILLNKSMYPQIPVQLLRWNKVKGKVVQGLTNRRKREIELWNKEFNNDKTVENHILY